MDTANMTASEIDLEKVAKEKEYKQALSTLHEIEIAELELAKEIVKLQAQRKELQIAASKARHIARTLAIEIRIFTSMFWAAKDNR